MTDDDDELEHLGELVRRADLDALVRSVEIWQRQGAWGLLLATRDRCRAAVATGRQLWPVATLAEYRLALHAPASWAACVLDEHSGRFTIGPLTEVVAQGHRFAELAPHLDDPVRAGFVAHECAARGEQIAGEVFEPLGIPFRRQPWEPPTPLAEYGDDGVHAPSPDRPRGGVRHPLDIADVLDDPEVDEAVRQLFSTWTVDSDGRVEVVCVEGTASAAVGALGINEAALTSIPHSDALAWLVWAGASGAAHGRRRGTAAGRLAMWWLVAALGDTSPDDLDGMAEAAAALTWSWWDAGEPSLGWEVQLAVEDREGCAWAISAHDAG